MKVIWKNRSYSEEDFRSAWQTATSLADVAQSLNLSRSGGSYRVIKETAEALDLSREVFDKAKHYRYTLEEILIENSPYRSTSHLRMRLIKEGILMNKCSAPYCQLPNEIVNPFTGVKIKTPTLTLDHINGDNRDNRLENLRILCQLCHSMTDTWCGKNKTRLTMYEKPPMSKIKVGLCGHTVGRSAVMCVKCTNSSRTQKKKIAWPSIPEIVDNVRLTNFSAYSKVLGVSDNAIRKHLRSNGIDPRSLSVLE